MLTICKTVKAKAVELQNYLVITMGELLSVGYVMHYSTAFVVYGIPTHGYWYLVCYLRAGILNRLFTRVLLLVL